MGEQSYALHRWGRLTLPVLQVVLVLGVVLAVPGLRRVTTVAAVLAFVALMARGWWRETLVLRVSADGVEWTVTSLVSRAGAGYRSVPWSSVHDLELAGERLRLRLLPQASAVVEARVPGVDVDAVAGVVRRVAPGVPVRVSP